MLDVPSTSVLHDVKSFRDSSAGSVAEVCRHCPDYISDCCFQCIKISKGHPFVDFVLQPAPEEEVAGGQIWGSSGPVFSKVLSYCPGAKSTPKKILDGHSDVGTCSILLKMHSKGVQVFGSAKVEQLWNIVPLQHLKVSH